MLSGHHYWNLEAYQETQDLVGHHAQFQASKFVTTDGDLIPSGQLSDVTGTPMDFRKAKSIGGDINATASGAFCGTDCVGFDNCWVLDKNDFKKPVFSVWSVNSGIKLDIITNQPAIQVYSCNGIFNPEVPIPRKKDQGGPSTVYENHSCMVIESESIIDAINNPEFGVDQIYGPRRPYNWEATSNHPAKLTKVASEIEKKLRHEARKARAGNIRARASLLISLAILRALATECRRDIALLSPSLIACVDVTMEAVPTDLEVVARAASVFTSWTTYTDGHLVGTDSTLTKDYLSALGRFSALSRSSLADHEVRNRTRLIGFAALSGTLNSDALYYDPAQFKAQVSTIMRPILVTLFETQIDTLDEQAAAVKGAPSSPYLAEFRSRPTIERRAASIHIHIDGDNGPSMADVSNASLRALYTLVGHANSAQLGFIMHSAFDSINDAQAWIDSPHCCWLSHKMSEWSQYQYRYAVPTWLVERLCRNQDVPSPITYHATVAEMATTVFNSPIPLVNLSTSDIASSLIALLLRRVESDPDDPLLASTIGCISSLGRHVYYSDQIQDLTAEVIHRISVVEARGAISHGKSGSGRSRSHAVRCLLAALIGLIEAANRSDASDKSSTHASSGSTPAESFRQEVAGNRRVSRRTPITPDIWQDTVSLLCDNDYAVRSDYADALVFYLSEEMPKLGDNNSNGDSGKRGLAEGPLTHAVKLNILLHAGNYGTKFLHAVHAYLYILATSSHLGLTSSSTTSQSYSTLDDTSRPRTASQNTGEDDGVEARESEFQIQVNGRPSVSTPQNPRARKASVVQRLLEDSPLGLASASACLADYSLIYNVLTTVHEELPMRGLLTGVPMLHALNALASSVDSSHDPAATQRVNAIKEVIARIWLVIGEVWNVPELMELAETALITAPNCLPSVKRNYLSTYIRPRRYSEFPPPPEGIVVWQGIDCQAAVDIIINCPSIHETIGVSRDGLAHRFSTPWTPELALKDSAEQSSSFENTLRGDGLTPLLKISPALMHIENISQQSLARSTRGVGVADLRGALEGRNSMSNPALARPASISTLEHAPSTTDGHLRLTQTRSKSRNKKRPPTSGGAGEVRDVLNRLGIGNKNGSLLKASFPALPKSTPR
ncbi:hypothetical protein H0H87_007911 [Tephrocybe sp. NHM501043]|nr:hypothetical protein H0H87_007911 [Tephrocybe sp. NHM501043]